MRKLTKGDKWKLFGMGSTLVMGLWGLWSSNLSLEYMMMHIKFIYSIFLSLAIILSAYYIILKKENMRKKKNVKKK